jgi:hypothetical protein
MEMQIKPARSFAMVVSQINLATTHAKRQKLKGKRQKDCRFAFLYKPAARRSPLLPFDFCLLPFNLPVFSQ